MIAAARFTGSRSRAGYAPAALLLAAAFLVAAGPAAAKDLVVTARVVKGPDRVPVPGQAVSVHVVRGADELPGATRTTDREGKVRFERIPEGADLEYYVSTEFKGAFYTEGPIRPAPDGALHQEMVVFDVGKEIDKVAVTNHHVIIEREPDGLNVNEIMIIENASDTAYLGIGANHAENAGMRLGLPTSVKDFHPGVGADEGTLVVQGREMMSLRPIPPGQRPLSFHYKIPLSGRIDLSHRFYFPTRTFVVMLDDPSLKLESKALTYAGSREQGGKRYEMYTGSNLDIGTDVEIRAKGAGFWSNPAVYPWLAVPFLIAGVLFTARRLSRRAPRTDAAAGAPPATGPSSGGAPRGAAPASSGNGRGAGGPGDADMARTYAFLIAALDQGRERGEISAESHGLLRGNLKRRLELLVADESTPRSR